MEEIKKKFIELVKKYGFGNEFYTFDLCTDYGCGLADSTIDKIEVDHSGHVAFFFNQNTGDYSSIYSFTEQDLNEFYNQLTEAIKEIEEEGDEEMVL